jgi:hypothetical protein
MSSCLRLTLATEERSEELGEELQEEEQDARDPVEQAREREGEQADGREEEHGQEAPGGAHRWYPHRVPHDRLGAGMSPADTRHGAAGAWGPIRRDRQAPATGLMPALEAPRTPTRLADGLGTEGVPSCRRGTIRPN